MIKIIDYRAGNAPSVLNAVNRLGYEAELARSSRELEGASRIILPGVGSARATMDSLRETGLLNAAENAVLRDKIPFLGICVGLQILFEYSEEENTDCLGWLKGRVVRFDASRVRVPQMGWNHVRFVKKAAFEARGGYFYFVNSFAAVPEDGDDLWGTADYNGPFAAAVCRDNINAFQFHAEKSGEAGLALLNGFLRAGNGGKKC